MNRTRIIVIGVALVVLSVVGAFLPQSVLASQLRATDQLLSAAVPIAVSLADRGSAPSSVSTSMSNVYVAKVGTDGSRTVLLRPLVDVENAPRSPSSNGAVGTAPIETVRSISGGGSWRAEFIARSDGTRILVASPFDAINDTARPVGVVLLISRLIGLAFLALSGWWLLRVALRPIREVTKVANAISSGDRSRRLAAGNPNTPAGRLASAFNDMLDEQHSSEDRLRRFVADASHELRTPVTAIGGFADLYRHGAIEPSQLDEVMRRIGQESARMRGLVEDMLLLARLDEGKPIVREPVDLATLARDAAFDASASYPSRMVRVDGDAMIVQAHESQVRQVLANLLGNALSYTEGDVTIDVRREGAFAKMSIEDAGPGLTPDTIDHMFDRFWRGDSSRTTTGSGLGLPIVRGIAHAHGGNVTITSTAGVGTTVTVTFRIDQQETTS